MQKTLVKFSNELTEIVSAVAPYTVSIQARRHHPSSGLRWKTDVIVTASHTVEREEEISITFADGTTAVATPAGRDPGTNLAVLRVHSATAGFVQIADADQVKASELAIVVGRSPDSGVNASLGIVSAHSGSWRTWRGGHLDAYIRLDASLENPAKDLPASPAILTSKS